MLKWLWYVSEWPMKYSTCNMGILQTVNGGSKKYMTRCVLCLMSSGPMKCDVQLPQSARVQIGTLKILAVVRKQGCFTG